MRITLDAGQIIRSRQEAVRDHQRATAHEWNRVGFDPGLWARLRYRIIAYGAEEAFARFLGIDDWRRDPNGFGKADVAGWSVRCASRPGYGLVVHDRDAHDSRFALVTHLERIEDMVYDMTGWLTKPEALAMRELGVGRPLPGSTDPWLIPPRQLHPWTTAPTRSSLPLST